MCCNKNQHKFDEKLKEQFFTTYKFSNHINNKIILLLQKVIYPYEYMDGYQKFNETPEREDFYSNINIEDTIDEDYAYAKEFVKMLK